MKKNVSVSLRNVIAALNGVEVKGEGNMDRLLGSIQELKALVIQVEQEAAEKTAKEPAEDPP